MHALAGRHHDHCSAPGRQRFPRGSHHRDVHRHRSGHGRGRCPRGWTTVATMRDPGKAATLRSAAEAAGVIVDVRPLDVTDPDSITMCVESVVADLGHLDAVLNNAGGQGVRDQTGGTAG